MGTPIAILAILIGAIYMVRQLRGVLNEPVDDLEHGDWPNLPTEHRLHVRKCDAGCCRGPRI